MGGAPKQVNSGQASGAYQGATGAAAGSEKLAASNQAVADDNHKMFFGDNGSLKGMMDPNSLNNPNLNNFYKVGYDQTVKQGENEAQNNQRGIFSTMSNRGLGVNSGVAADYQRKAELDRANSKGSAYADAVGMQHGEALNNFWGATNVAANEENAARGNAVTAQGNAGQTFSNLYGTAGQQSRPGIGTSLLSGGLQAGGMVGAAAMCPAENALILTPEGPKKVQSLKKGDRITQKGFVSAPLACDPIAHPSMPLVFARTQDGNGGETSRSHAFERADSGYAMAMDSLGKVVNTINGKSVVSSAYDAGFGTVYELITEGDTNHTYCADGMWSLE